jgi:hypothetical protein
MDTLAPHVERKVNVCGHAVRTKLEDAVCQDLCRKGVLHDHDVTPTEVTLADGRRVKFKPEIMITYEGNTILVVCVASCRRGDTRMLKLRSFREQNRKFYHIVVATSKGVAGKIPEDVYDDLLVL